MKHFPPKRKTSAGLYGFSMACGADFSSEQETGAAAENGAGGAAKPSPVKNGIKKPLPGNADVLEPGCRHSEALRCFLLPEEAQTVFWIENEHRHGIMPANHAPPFHPTP
ncbi:hypothetical protein [Akkermansia muciniphila]|uniref:hypothetical protein n=1 Tax=Akkermansia muciniphila TaxID=239935 RepID=UPI001BFF1D2B|nr:hypothetical protein [Akkermansia muciniphila]MBT8777143.1 hypothetical protein [Akkermansia muciniphila]